MGRGGSETRTPLDMRASVPDLVMTEVSWREQPGLPMLIAGYRTPELDRERRTVAISQTPVGVVVDSDIHAPNRTQRGICFATIEDVRARRCCADLRACHHRAAISPELEPMLEEVERWPLEMVENEVARAWIFKRQFGPAAVFRGRTLTGTRLVTPATVGRQAARISEAGVCIECGNALCAIGSMHAYASGLVPWDDLVHTRIDEARSALEVLGPGSNAKIISVNTRLPLVRGTLELRISASWLKSSLPTLDIVPWIKGLAPEHVTLWPHSLRETGCGCFESDRCKHIDLVRALAPGLFHRRADRARASLSGARAA